MSSSIRSSTPYSSESAFPDRAQEIRSFLHTSMPVDAILLMHILYMVRGSEDYAKKVTEELWFYFQLLKKSIT